MRFFEKVPVRVQGMVQNSAEYFIIEIKSLFSIIITRLGPWGETYPHTHPFKAITLLLKGRIVENSNKEFSAGSFKLTNEDWHSVSTRDEGAWFITFRGPWKDTWKEMDGDGKITTFTHGRKVVE